MIIYVSFLRLPKELNHFLLMRARCQQEYVHGWTEEWQVMNQACLNGKQLEMNNLIAELLLKALIALLALLYVIFFLKKIGLVLNVILYNLKLTQVMKAFIDLAESTTPVFKTFNVANNYAGHLIVSSVL